MKDLVIGIDVGGQSTKLGVVNGEGEIIAQTVISSLQEELIDYINELTKAIKGLIAETAETGKVKGIGIGAPNGNYYKGTVEYAPNLKWSYDLEGKPTVVELASLVKSFTGLPVTVTNDANAAAMGEMAYGVARGMKDFIMITLGTGVGSGIVVNGEVVYGSAMGVRRTAQKLLMTHPETKSPLRDIDPEKISSKDVYDAAETGDEVAIEIFKTTGQILGRSLADFVKFSAPEAIVLFGGLAKAKKYFHDDLVAAMEENQLQIWKGRIKVLYSSLKDSDAAILGASALAW